MKFKTNDEYDELVDELADVEHVLSVLLLQIEEVHNDLYPDHVSGGASEIIAQMKTELEMWRSLTSGEQTTVKSTPEDSAVPGVVYVITACSRRGNPLLRLFTPSVEQATLFCELRNEEETHSNTPWVWEYKEVEFVTVEKKQKGAADDKANDADKT